MSDKPKWEMDSPYGEVKDDRSMKATKKHSKRSIGIGLGTLALVLVLVLLVSSLGDIGKVFNGTGLSASEGDTADRPSLETIYTASPFYAPDINYTSEIGKEHTKNINKKIDEIIDVTEEMMDSYISMKDEINETINIIVPLLEFTDEMYGTTYASESEVLAVMDELLVAYELQEFKYYGLDIDNTGEILYDSDTAFARVTAAVEASEKITEAYHLLVNYSTTIYITYAAESNLEVQQKLNALQESFEKSQADEYGATLMAGVDTVNEMIHQIDAGNALLALDNLTIMGENMNQVKEDVVRLENADIVDEEFVELSQLMVEEYETMYLALNDALEVYVDGLELGISEDIGNTFSNLFKPTVVLATTADNRFLYGGGYNVQMLQKKGQEYMAQQRKAYQEKYKDETYWQSTVRIAKEVRKASQDVVEDMDAATFEVARTVAGKFTPSLGDADKDTYEDIKKRKELAKKRKEENKGGVDVFKTAVDGFEATQQLAGDGWYNIAAFWEDELGLPEDSVAQVASTMGSIAAETFTQFGQGISRILDPNAKDSDIAKGCIEVATSMVGGSQNVFSATKASGAALKKMSEIIVSPKLHAQGVIDAVKAVKEFSLSKLGSIKYTEKAVKGTMAILKKSKDVAKNMVGKLDDAFTHDITGIFTKNWKESLDGFRVYANKVGGNVDDSAVKLIDEFINGYIDNKVTELASHPWLWDPDVSDEDKEKLLAGEVEKMNEDIEQGLETIQGQLEDSVLNGKYNGTWTLLDVHYLGSESLDSKNGPRNLYEGYQERIGESYPCIIEANGSILTFTMSPQPTIKGGLTLVYNTDDFANNYQQPLVKNLEVILNKGEITGFKVETHDDIFITSIVTKEKTVIEGQYYFRFHFEQEFITSNFSVDGEGAWGVTFGFHVERNN
ncbi:MAG: hypothetical protein ACOWWR_17805 [Eubacteriales bacterium]